MGKLNFTTEQVGALLAKVSGMPSASDVLTPSALAPYATVAAVEMLAQAVEGLRSELAGLKGRFETLLGQGDVSGVIDTFAEMEAFLAGVTNAETLTGLMAQQRAEIVALIPTGVASQSSLDMVNAKVGALEISSASHDSGIASLQTAMAKRPALPENMEEGMDYVITNGAYAPLYAKGTTFLRV